MKNEDVMRVFMSSPAAADPAAEAFRAFERWRQEHDPDGEMDILAAATAYAEWADKNSIKSYLDAAQRT